MAYADIDKLLNTLPDDLQYKASVKRVLMQAPTTDVVEVVRCKDCGYGEIDNADFPDQYFCHYSGCDWNDGNHFCSDGTPKERGGE